MDTRSHPAARRIGGLRGPARLGAAALAAATVAGAVSTVATGINNLGDIAGFATDASGVTSSWLRHAGQLTAYQFPGGSSTQAFGVNTKDQIAGSYPRWRRRDARVRAVLPAGPPLALAGHR